MSLPNMQRLVLYLALLIALTHPAFTLEVANKQVAMIYLKTCTGWCLKQYTEAKTFMEQDMDHYDPKVVQLDKLGGGFPRLVLVDENGDNIKTYDISKINRVRIRAVFKSLEIPIVRPLRPLDVIDLEKVQKKIYFWNIV